MMPVQLLPASAAAFAPRASSVNVVLGSKAEPWLTRTLKRINRVKRPLNSVQQHQRCLSESLSSPDALWTLSCLMLPKGPESELRTDPDPLVEAMSNYQLLHVEAYIVHVDMILRNEVAFKLTVDTIDALIGYHKDIHCVNAKADTYDWSDTEQQCKKLHEDFIQAVNKFVFRTPVSALEGLEEGGTGELLRGRSDEVKSQILAMMKPLLPPLSKMVDVIRQPHPPSSPVNPNLWSHPATPLPRPVPVESWRFLPSNSEVATTSASAAAIWANMSMNETQLLPTSPAFTIPPLATTGLFYSSPVVAPPVAQRALSSKLTPQCRVNMGYGGFGWDRYQEYTTTM